MIRDVLLLQKRELETKLTERFVEREIDYEKFDNDLIKVIIGPRRAGKSFLGFHILSKELSTHLTGRHLLINIFPFSFQEFLKLEGKELTSNEIKDRLFTYLTYGGYPETWVKEVEHKEYLSTLFNSIIYKDIVKRFRIRLVIAIEDLATYLISNIAKEFSYHTLSKTTKCKSVHTVEKYLDYLG